MADENEMGTKEDTSGRAVKTGKTSKVKTTFVGVATKLWNRAPTSITQAEALKGGKERNKEVMQNPASIRNNCNIKERGVKVRAKERGQ